jgi:hypothetical protein
LCWCIAPRIARPGPYGAPHSSPAYQQLIVARDHSRDRSIDLAIIRSTPQAIHCDHPFTILDLAVPCARANGIIGRVMKKKTNPKTHQQLRTTSRAIQNAVRALSKDDLEEASGGEDRTFNYPNG